MKALCKTCGKVVRAKNGRFACCGFDEPVAKSRRTNKELERKLFPDPVISHWNEDSEEFDIYEGIPNT